MKERERERQPEHDPGLVATAILSSLFLLLYALDGLHSFLFYPHFS